MDAHSCSLLMLMRTGDLNMHDVDSIGVGSLFFVTTISDGLEIGGTRSMTHRGREAHTRIRT